MFCKKARYAKKMKYCASLSNRIHICYTEIISFSSNEREQQIRLMEEAMKKGTSVLK